MNGPTRTDDVTRTLREEVLRGRFRPGERLPSERELAARFDTTRAVARVALKSLEQLGLAVVQPGGARVEPVSQASPEVIGHLLELSDPPDPQLVDQVLEVVGALISANLRMTVERASAEQLELLDSVAERLKDPNLGDDEHQVVMHEFGQAFLDATDNVVMRMVRRSLRAEVFPRLQGITGAAFVPGEPSALRPDHLLSRAEALQHVQGIAKAVRNRDGLAAYEAAHQLWSTLRARVRAHLEARKGEAPQDPGESRSWTNEGVGS